VLRALALWGPVAAWMAAIFFVSARPIPGPAQSLPDWTTHVAAYAVLGVLMGRAVSGARPAVTAREALLAAALSAAYGVTDEVHQAFVPGRNPDVRDAAFDLAGSALGAAFHRQLKQALRRVAAGPMK
jgi:VanZ family protein